MVGAVDEPTFSEFATDPCPRSMDPPLSKDSEGAPQGLSFPACSEDFFNSVSGSQAAPPGALASSQPSLEQCGATAASLRNALSSGDYALGMLCKDIPEGALDEVHAWGYADDEEAFANILIFTDGSGTMTDSWPPQPRDAGWSSGRRIDESFGDVPLSNVRAD